MNTENKTPTPEAPASEAPTPEAPEAEAHAPEAVAPEAASVDIAQARAAETLVTEAPEATKTPETPQTPEAPKAPAPDATPAALLDIIAEAELRGYRKAVQEHERRLSEEAARKAVENARGVWHTPGASPDSDGDNTVRAGAEVLRCIRKGVWED